MTKIQFPEYSSTRCLMMPYIQGDPDSIPRGYAAYRDIVSTVALERGAVGFLTIDESPVAKGAPHRGARSRYARALHTEAGLLRGTYGWGPPSPGWGGRHTVTLDRDVKILVASNADDTCAVWDAEHEDTSEDGDIGHEASRYPYQDATLLKAGEVREIGIFTPHESLPAKCAMRRQFIRIVGAGVHGREEYFTVNPLVEARA